MKPFSLLVAVALFVTAVATRAADAPAKPDPDQKVLVGVWAVQSAEVRGEKAEELVGSTMTFSEEKIVLKVKGQDNSKEAKYTINSSSKPKQIDVMPTEETETRKGIYELEGDTLKICMGDKPSEARPEKFETAAEKKFVLLTLKREKK